MKIISWNVNGIRAIYKKGFLNWFRKADADIVCLQEIKAQLGQVPSDLIRPACASPHADRPACASPHLPASRTRQADADRPALPKPKWGEGGSKDYFSYFNPATRPGYAGVAVFTKKKPLKVENKLGLKMFDQEGRVLKLTYPKFTLMNLYLPHGGRQKEKLDYKLEVYKYLFENVLTFLAAAKKVRKERMILVGDFNIAHKEIDLARPKDNKNNIMFTPEERAQIDKIIDLGFTDTFRQLNKEGGHYTWWPYFARARERNLGWRIDYVFVSQELTPKLKDAFILSEAMGSDHCPIGLDIEI